MSRAMSRRNYFVRPEFQGKFILNNLAIALLGSISFALLAAVFSAGTRAFVYRGYALEVGSPGMIFLREFASGQLLYLVAVGIVVIFFSIIMSHRLAGPMVKMEKALGAMARGDYSGHITLRSKDEGKGLAEKINAVTLNLGERMGGMDQVLQELEERLANTEVASDRKELVELVGRLRSNLAYFTFSQTASEK